MKKVDATFPLFLNTWWTQLQPETHWKTTSPSVPGAPPAQVKVRKGKIYMNVLHLHVKYTGKIDKIYW